MTYKIYFYVRLEALASLKENYLIHVSLRTITRPRKRALLDQKHRRENKIGSERKFKKELNSCRKVKAYPTFPCLTPVDFMEEPREVIHLGSNNREPQDRHSAFPGEIIGLSKPPNLSVKRVKADLYTFVNLSKGRPSKTT